MTIAAEKLVSIEYTLTDETEEVLDTNVGGDPFFYVHGRSEIVTGLESALTGKKPGDVLSVVVDAESGYGLRDEEALIEVPLEHVPEGARQVGTRLRGEDDEGRPVFPLVHELAETSAVLDFNHPLAGKTLHFEVKVLSVGEPPSPGEAR